MKAIYGTGIPIVILVIFFFACNNLYKAGSRVPLMDLKITTNVNDRLIYSYLDSINSKIDTSKGYPFVVNGGDLQYFPDINKIAYFVDSPFEAYHLSSNGLFKLAEVYNPNKSMNWITKGENLTKEDYNRIERRINSLLKGVVKNAKDKNVPDTVVFWEKPYDTVICKLETPYDQ
ncbi:hypothetical protein [Chitinophaga sp. LS1]|uniref:hypothetical protein n=1 Tax=Chitinophaga sp. LS1 TaxID=3051176 RepID=UPI002AABF52E|nr:hypothetical protein [Chitinophaga sp. LS1]WPV63959.1 hypothetical protein QQL36_19350 [Chitinophaga sp. LS1]